MFRAVSEDEQHNEPEEDGGQSLEDEMLLKFFLQQKQWARLLRGLTVASISPQPGHRKRK